jgi:hypothetical protein
MPSVLSLSFHVRISGVGAAVQTLLRAASLGRYRLAVKVAANCFSDRQSSDPAQGKKSQLWEDKVGNVFRVRVSQ